MTITVSASPHEVDVAVYALHHCHIQIDRWIAIASADLSPEAFAASDIVEAYSQAAIRFAGALDDRALR